MTAHTLGRYTDVTLQQHFDAHAHYDDKWFDDDRFELLENIHTKGVCGIVNNAVDLETAKPALNMPKI